MDAAGETVGEFVSLASIFAPDFSMLLVSVACRLLLLERPKMRRMFFRMSMGWLN